VARELRAKLGHAQFGAHEDHGHSAQHGTDPASHTRHISMAEAIRDCQALLCGGMGRGAYSSMEAVGVTPVVTEETDIDRAALAYAAGTLADHPNCYTKPKEHRMPSLPAPVSAAFDAHAGPIVLTTVDAAGVPNSIYATCVKKYDEGRLVVADNFFSKTRANILAGSKGALLFITEEGASYQVKGSFEYLTSGEIFDDMKTWLNPKLPGHAAAVLHVEQVFKGGEQLL
jgi:predicted pyridoxine 5'-phosphate oxidase superfamily flavin-nucleotide-binding protein